MTQWQWHNHRSV